MGNRNFAKVICSYITATSSQIKHSISPLGSPTVVHSYYWHRDLPLKSCPGTEFHWITTKRDTKGLTQDSSSAKTNNIGFIKKKNRYFLRINILKSNKIILLHLFFIFKCKNYFSLGDQSHHRGKDGFAVFDTQFVIPNDLERNPCSWLGISLGTIASRFSHDHREMGRFREHNSKRGDVKRGIPFSCL